MFQHVCGICIPLLAGVEVVDGVGVSSVVAEKERAKHS